MPPDTTSFTVIRFRDEEVALASTLASAKEAIANGAEPEAIWRIIADATEEMLQTSPRWWPWNAEIRANNETWAFVAEELRRRKTLPGSQGSKALTDRPGDAA